MKSELAFEKASVARAAGQPTRVFDWNKAARIIRERGIKDAEAGLSSDLEWTAGEIIANGEPVTDSYTYLASIWATPVIVVRNGDETTEIPCWCMQEGSGFDSGTKWPESALAILRGEVQP